ncbi:MAG: hypothetical protein J0M07_32830 [Anaerolineae bacterium]|nr:hypothetical protein [Anaerolineae bacterium]
MNRLVRPRIAETPMNTPVQEITFRDPRPPHDLQAILEREIMAVLRPSREGGRLVYRAAFKVNGAPYTVLLRHELALLSANVYVLRFELDLDPIQPAHRDYELKGMSGWVGLWTREFKPEPLRPGETGREDRRAALEQEAFAAEARLTTVADYQRAVLEGGGEVVLVKVVGHRA